ncbi:N-acetyltransferase [Acrasis kona]|uniref:N-acetyltransferase n=1 Tax=Acrasis kona TaxID=1008807 RepID=A0AAW2ZBX5_9EUKA
MNVEQTQFLKLHEHQGYIDQTIDLLNSEWPKSVSYREKVLRSSTDDLPVNLILVKGDNVVGFCRLIKTQESMLGVESVVTDKNVRGQGYGRILMEGVEEMANKYYEPRIEKGKEHYLYLYTNTAQGFYEKCGFEITSAPQGFGSVVSNLNSGQLSGLAAMLQKRQQSLPHENTNKDGSIWMRKQINKV